MRLTDVAWYERSCDWHIVGTTPIEESVIVYGEHSPQSNPFLKKRKLDR